MTLAELTALPEHLPKRLRRYLVMHMKIQGGGMATYRMGLEDGRMLPIVYAYNTNDPSQDGYRVDHEDATKIYTGKELLAAWPKIRQILIEKATP